MVITLGDAAPKGATLKQQNSAKTVEVSAQRVSDKPDGSGRGNRGLLHEAQWVGVPDALASPNLGSDEKLFVVAHGDGKLVGKKTPTELAQMLWDAGLRKALLVNLVSCRSAFTDDEIDQSYGSKLAIALHGKGVQLKYGVKGRLDISGPTAKGKILTQKNTKEDIQERSNANALYQELLQWETDEQAFEAYKTYMTNWGAKAPWQAKQRQYFGPDGKAYDSRTEF